MSKKCFKLFFVVFEPFLLTVLLFTAMIARLVPKKIDIGLGPLPLINNLYHKKVFEKCGYSAQTYTNQIWHITSDFDVIGCDHLLKPIPVINNIVTMLRLTLISLFRYRCNVFYFNGGPLGVYNSVLLWRIEPLLYKIAGVKTIVLAYGSDVQAMSRSNNLIFKDALSQDYPDHKFNHKRIQSKIDLWSNRGDWVVGGCEWVDYMHHWDSLMISHFSIDDEKWNTDVETNDNQDKPFTVLHAPNHRNIKGTQFIIDAVDSLKQEGLDIQLVLIEKRPNHEVQELIRTSDLIVDQLIVGWYAMFAIEAMAMGKPVVCNLRDDLIELYRYAGFYETAIDNPLIHATTLTIKDVILTYYNDREALQDRGRRGRDYVMKHHSIDAISVPFGHIANKLIGAPKGNNNA